MRDDGKGAPALDFRFNAHGTVEDSRDVAGNKRGEISGF
jgi:hypothetical protein